MTVEFVALFTASIGGGGDCVLRTVAHLVVVTEGLWKSAV